MLIVQKSYTPSNARIFRHGYVYTAQPGHMRSTPQGIETPAMGRKTAQPSVHPTEGSTSSFSLAPLWEPESRATLEPESPV
jgi:hypothetical protein